jgi:hypothetical protein
MRIASAAAALLICCGCAFPPLVRPAANVPTLPGRGDAAVAEANGVKEVVIPDAWDGYPSDLPWITTPLEVSLENHSGRALRVQFKSFSLRTRSGTAALAMSPYKFEQPGTQLITPNAPGYPFMVAPPYASYAPGYLPWVSPVDADPNYYDPSKAWSPTLPSPDMVSRALAEGLVDAGGRVHGFLYFPQVPNARGVPLELVSELPDAESGTIIAKLAVGLVVNP